MRLIDADEMAIVESEAYMEVNTREDISAVNWALNSVVHRKIQQLIANTPAVDAVPVVRCGECEYAAKAKWNKKGYRICPVSHMEITDNDFCSYGERRCDNG